MKTKNLRICIDLDGVICHLKKNDEGYETLLPIEGAIEKINKLKDQGHYIIIYTARRMKTNKANIPKVIADIGKITLDWLIKYNIPYDEIMFGKPWADVYIDDNAYRFNSWDEVFADGTSLPVNHEKKIKSKE